MGAMNTGRRASLRLQDLPPSARAGLVAAVGWTLAWKGVSLWRAARNGSKPWFVALLLSNTMGVLDALYLFVVDRDRRALDADEEKILDQTGEPEQLGRSYLED
jgi:hypothetical protein